MLKVLYFLPCEKMILDREGGVSLISILERLNLDSAKLQAELAEVPQSPTGDLPDLLIPMMWDLVSYFPLEPSIDGKEFEQKVYMELPGGGIFGEAIVKFKFEGKSHRNRVRVGGFPISPEGTAYVKLQVREAGSESWHDVAQYPIEIRHVNP